jgi:hypothetical protein
MNFTIIDCCLKDSIVREKIIDEIISESRDRVSRFISTHPHDDHIHGLDYLDEKWPIRNFYAVENDRVGQGSSFKAYLKLKRNFNYNLERNIQRKWLNIGDSDCGSAGIHIHWPVRNNCAFQDALRNCQDEPNAISAVIEYRTEYFRVIWMGDMESDMQASMYEEIKGTIGPVDVLFLPHHGRSSANLPENLLQELDPKLIIVGAAPCNEIDYDYYDSDKTLTQNTALDFELLIDMNCIHVLAEGDIDNAPKCLLKLKYSDQGNMHYQGTLVKGRVRNDFKGGIDI